MQLAGLPALELYHEIRNDRRTSRHEGSENVGVTAPISQSPVRWAGQDFGLPGTYGSGLAGS